MCGRFVLLTLRDFTDLFPWIRAPNAGVPPRYNIAPTQDVVVVANKQDPAVEFYRWGLVPSWAKDPDIGNRMINARAETLAEKPAFRTALRRRRCLVPANGFYEWRKNHDGTKTPMYITMKSGRPFAFAGLWDQWEDAQGTVVPTCTIITTDANDLVRPIHDRMPVILPNDRCQDWLNPAEMDPKDLLDILKPYPPGPMQAAPVSRLVNNPKHDSPDCIACGTEEPHQPPARRPSRRARRPNNTEGGLFA